MQRKCASCQRPYEAKRPNSKFCGDTCGKRARRSPKAAAEKLAEPVPVAVTGGLVSVMKRDLLAAGVLDTPAGQMSMSLARRIDSPMETGASVASMTKQLREVLVDAFKGATQVADPLDVLRVRRDAKQRLG